MTDPRAYRPEEDSYIIAEWERGTRIADIAAALKRSDGSIKNRARRLGMEKRRLGANMQTNKEKAKPYKRPEAVFVAYGNPRPLLNVGTFECHFPIEGSNNFCGAAATRAYGYCRGHNKICYK